MRALAESLKKRYGYGSQVPGARHGRHTDLMLAYEEALYVVRTCGSANTHVSSCDRASQ